MVYIIEIHVDGGCRGNGGNSPYGAAAAVLTQRWGKTLIRTQELCWEDDGYGWYGDNPKPTNQRAEITAIILGIKLALDKCNQIDQGTRIAVTINSDSTYAVNCMKQWIYKWHSNGWTNCAGMEVANRDLLERASRLDDVLRDVANVTYKWVPREQNQVADRYCNEVLDEM